MNSFFMEGIELVNPKSCGLCKRKDKGLLRIKEIYGFPGENGHLDCFIKFLAKKYVKEAIEEEKKNDTTT